MFYTKYVKLRGRSRIYSRERLFVSLTTSIAGVVGRGEYEVRSTVGVRGEGLEFSKGLGWDLRGMRYAVKVLVKG